MASCLVHQEHGETVSWIQDFFWLSGETTWGWLCKYLALHLSKQIACDQFCIKSKDKMLRKCNHFVQLRYSTKSHLWGDFPHHYKSTTIIFVSISGGPNFLDGGRYIWEIKKGREVRSYSNYVSIVQKQMLFGLYCSIAKNTSCRNMVATPFS